MSKEHRRPHDCSGCSMPIYRGEGSVEYLETGKWWHARCAPDEEFRSCSRCGHAFQFGEKVKPLGMLFAHVACVASDLRLDGLGEIASRWEATT